MESAQALEKLELAKTPRTRPIGDEFIEPLSSLAACCDKMRSNRNPCEVELSNGIRADLHTVSATALMVNRIGAYLQSF